MTKIVGLQVQNFKRIKTVEVHPNGESIVVGGRNAQGKTSLLDAVWAALGGGRAAPKEPIRRGQTKAKIVVELDGLTVTRKFTARGSKLEVVGADGDQLRSPQSVLDRLTGALTFDPLAFTRQAPREQAETLRRLAGLDLEAIDEEIQEATNARKEAKKYAARLHAQDVPEVDDAPEAETDISELLSQLNAAEEQKRERREVVLRLERTKQDIDQLLERAKRLQVQVEADTSVLEGLPAPVDTETLRVEVEAANEANRRFHLARRAEEAKASRRQADEEVEEAEELVSALRSTRAKLIEETEFPVKGLSVTDDGVTFNGVLLEQASAAEKIRISTAVGLAQNPGLRVMFVRDGSLLDDESLAEILSTAARDDLQLWVERVGGGKSVGVVIEDGQVKS